MYIFLFILVVKLFMDKESRKVLLVFIFSFLAIVGIEQFSLSNYGRAEIRNNKLEGSTGLSTSRMTYGRFLDYIEKGWVQQVDLYDNCRNAIVQASSPELGDRPQAIRVELPIASTQLIQKLKQYDINFDAHPLPKKSIVLILVSNLLIPLAFLGGLYFLFRESDYFSDYFPQIPGNSPLDTMGKSPARFYANPQTGVTFKDVAGINEARARLEEIVSFLNTPEKYTRLGARIPSGILLIGPPGTGKTLLAKAIATEAGVPFFDVSGSEFVEVYVGVGAARIRDLFDQAIEVAPSLIFIDEIDAVGRRRGSGVGSGNDEREQTLNQLLTEMDGFIDNRGIIVIAATNRVDILDEALIRPGRFDRKINIGLPNKIGRYEILKVHARNKPLEESICLKAIAKKTPGFTGARLATVLNEAAILSCRFKRDIILQEDIEEAIERIVYGARGKPMKPGLQKTATAYREVGRAIVATMLEYHEPVDKISLIPRGGKKAATYFVIDEDQTLITRGQLLSRISQIGASRITERIVFGPTDITTATTQDLQEAAYIARLMVTTYGLSSLGPIAFKNVTSPYQKNRIDKETREIVEMCNAISYKIILDHRVVLDVAVRKLLIHDVLTGDQLTDIISQYTDIPEKKACF